MPNDCAKMLFLLSLNFLSSFFLVSAFYARNFFVKKISRLEIVLITSLYYATDVLVELMVIPSHTRK